MADFKEISPNASAGAKLTNWFENRLPTAFDMYKVHMSEYYAPKNFNFWYIFGSLAMLVLVIQIVTGIFWSCITSRMLHWHLGLLSTSCVMYPVAG